MFHRVPLLSLTASLIGKRSNVAGHQLSRSSISQRGRLTAAKLKTRYRKNMTIQNAWWESDPEQRFWLEITDRDNLGENLLSPQLGRNGRSTPGYELMTHVKPGDIIFHYWQQADQEPAIVSYSVAISNAQPSTIVWKL